METEVRSRVVLIPCDTYEEETVYERLKEGVALLGGMEQFVKPEDKVLLKPNLVRKAELSRSRCDASGGHGSRGKAGAGGRSKNCHGR